MQIVREVNSYNWFLKKQIEAQTKDGICEPCYDFIFIDGAKNWTIDGLAFFLADKLLRPEPMESHATPHSPQATRRCRNKNIRTRISFGHRQVSSQAHT